jgi:hypothetical protein
MSSRLNHHHLRFSFLSLTFIFSTVSELKRSGASTALERNPRPTGAAAVDRRLLPARPRPTPAVVAGVSASARRFATAFRSRRTLAPAIIRLSISVRDTADDDYVEVCHVLFMSVVPAAKCGVVAVAGGDPTRYVGHAAADVHGFADGKLERVKRRRGRPAPGDFPVDVGSDRCLFTHHEVESAKLGNGTLTPPPTNFLLLFFYFGGKFSFFRSRAYATGKSETQPPVSYSYRIYPSLFRWEK